MSVAPGGAASTTQKIPRPVSNVIANWLAFVVTSVVSFFLSPFVVHHLGSGPYGVWVLVGSLTGYMGLLDLGVRGAVTKYVAGFHSQGQHEAASRIVSSALGIFAALASLAIVVSVVLTVFVLDAFKIPAEQLMAARVVLLLSGINVGLALVNGVFGGILAALQRFALASHIEVVISLLRAALTVAALSLGYGLIALAVIQLTLTLVILLVNMTASLRLYPTLRIRRSHCERDCVKMIFSFSAYSFLLHLSAFFMFYADSLVIGAFLPVTMVTFFAISGNLLSYSRALVSGLSTTVTPLMSAMQGAGHEEELGRVLLKGTRFATLAVLPIAATFLLRGRSFIELWMGPQFGALSGEILAILTLSLIFGAATQVIGAGLAGLNKHRALVPAVVAEAVLNVTLSIVLVRSLGVVGVAWGTTIPSLAASLCSYPFFVRYAFKVPISTFVHSTWVRPIVGMVPFAGCTFLVERFVPAGNLLIFFLQVAVLMPVALAGAWVIALPPEDRRQLNGALWPRPGRAAVD